MTPELADERAAWAADIDRLRGHEHVQQPADPIRCPIHGLFVPHSIIDTECRRCLDHDDNQRAIADAEHGWHYTTYPR